MAHLTPVACVLSAVSTCPSVPTAGVSGVGGGSDGEVAFRPQMVSLATLPRTGGVDAQVPSPRQKVLADAPVPLLRFVTGRLPVTAALLAVDGSETNVVPTWKRAIPARRVPVMSATLPVVLPLRPTTLRRPTDGIWHR